MTDVASITVTFELRRWVRPLLNAMIPPLCLASLVSPRIADRAVDWLADYVARKGTRMRIGATAPIHGGDR